MKGDMTQGNPWKLIISFMIPVLLGNIFQNLYSIVDSMIVGRLLGTKAFAAVGVTAAQGFIVFGWINGMTSGFSIILAQEYGAKREKSLRHFFCMSLYLCIFMCVIMTVGLLLTNDWVLRLMQTPKELFDLAGRYILVIYGGIFSSIAYNLLAGTLRAFGDSRTPLKLLTIASVLNVVLDLVFISWFHMGVEGTAYATVLSQVVSAMLCLWHIRKHYRLFGFTREERRFSARSMGTLFKIGLPMALQFSITGFSTVIVQGAVNSFGALYISAMSVVGKIQGIMGQPMVAIGAAISSYAGQNYGAGRIARVKQGVRVGNSLCVATSCLCTVLLLAFGKALVPLFIREDVAAVQEIVHQFLLVVAWFYVPLSLIYVYRNTLQGLGEGLVPFLGGVFELIARIIAIGFLMRWFGFYGVILSDPLAWIFALIPLVPYYYYRMGRITRSMENEGLCTKSKAG